MSKPLFYVLGKNFEESDSVVNDINRSMCTCRNFKKAYEMALFFGEIKNPDLTYRQALTKYKEDESVYIKEKGTGEEGNEGLITRINLY